MSADDVTERQRELDELVRPLLDKVERGERLSDDEGRRVVALLEMKQLGVAKLERRVREERVLRERRFSPAAAVTCGRREAEKYAEFQTAKLQPSGKSSFGDVLARTLHRRAVERDARPRFIAAVVKAFTPLRARLTRPTVARRPARGARPRGPRRVRRSVSRARSPGRLGDRGDSDPERSCPHDVVASLGRPRRVAA